MSKDVSKLSDKERFEMNRRRRLMNEEESKQKEKEAKSSQMENVLSARKSSFLH